MAGLFSLLFLTSFVLFVVSFFRPVKIYKIQPSNRKQSLLIYGLLTFVSMMITGSLAPKQPATSKAVQPTAAQVNTVKPEKKKPTDAPRPTTAKRLEIGDSGYLRIPGNKDPEQLILLATDKEYISDVSKALMSKDGYSIMEVVKDGKAFAVQNGTEIKVIDFTTGSRRVRIMNDTRAPEIDMSGKAGWVPFEFISAK